MEVKWKFVYLKIMFNVGYIKVGKYKNGYIEFKKLFGSSMGMKECNIR